MSGSGDDWAERDRHCCAPLHCALHYPPPRLPIRSTNTACSPPSPSPPPPRRPKCVESSRPEDHGGLRRTAETDRTFRWSRLLLPTRAHPLRHPTTTQPWNSWPSYSQRFSSCWSRSCSRERATAAAAAAAAAAPRRRRPTTDPTASSTTTKRWPRSRRRCARQDSNLRTSSLRQWTHARVEDARRRRCGCGCGSGCARIADIRLLGETLLISASSRGLQSHAQHAVTSAC